MGICPSEQIPLTSGALAGVGVAHAKDHADGRRDKS